MPNSDLNELLKQTSRSFYLTLRVLPRAIRPQISLAYLLARTADTIADTEIVSVAQRLEALQQFRQRVAGTTDGRLNFGALAQQQGLPAERLLLERVASSLERLDQLPEGDRKRVRQVLATITSGQELDLERFNDAAAERIKALQTQADLDDYTYRVAGCVGEFWTHMCRRHLFPLVALDEKKLLVDGVRFGQGLQLVNILRDLPADLRKGRCYLPEVELRAAGLTPADLLTPANDAKFRPAYRQWLDLAESHLAAGWHYTNTIPFLHVRVRLACAWPILIGLETLQRLRAEPVLDPQHRVKISRPEVRNLMWRSIVRYPLPRSWRGLAQFSKT